MKKLIENGKWMWQPIDRKSCQFIINECLIRYRNIASQSASGTWILVDMCARKQHGKIQFYFASNSINLKSIVFDYNLQNVYTVGNSSIKADTCSWR